MINHVRKSLVYLLYDHILSTNPLLIRLFTFIQQFLKE